MPHPPDRDHVYGMRNATGRKGRAALAGLVGFAAAGLALTAGAGGARALPVSLVDDNAVATVDPSSAIGLSSWSVAGITHVSRQGFWLRIGASGPESPLSSLGLVSSVLSDSNGDGDDDVLAVRYGNTAVGVDLRYSLDGGPLGPPEAGATSTLGVQVSVQNLTGSSLDLHLFQYTDVDLFGTFVDDTLVLGPGGGVDTVTAGDSTGLALYEAVFTPDASAAEAALYGATLPRLGDADPIALDGALSAAGDVTWTVEWARALSAGETLSLGLAQRIEIPAVAVPEPGALGLLASAWAAQAIVGRRRREGRTGCR